MICRVVFLNQRTWLIKAKVVPPQTMPIVTSTANITTASTGIWATPALGDRSGDTGLPQACR